MENIIYSSPETAPVDNLTIIKRLPYEGKRCAYYASNFGQILAYDAKRMKVVNCIRKSFNRKTYFRKSEGYVSINTGMGNPLRSKFVHRLIAEVFCAGKSTFRNQVDHIDNNPRNNRADNLRWCTCKENHRYAREIRTGERIITNLQKAKFYVTQ